MTSRRPAVRARVSDAVSRASSADLALAPGRGNLGGARGGNYRHGRRRGVSQEAKKAEGVGVRRETAASEQQRGGRFDFISDDAVNQTHTTGTCQDRYTVPTGKDTTAS